MSIKNVAIYLRKSRDEENEEKEIVLKRHETQLLEYCRRNNLIVSNIYREIVSGDTIEKRPEMQKLLDDVSAKLYDGVVCMEIERLSRGNQIDQLEILETFKASATKIYTLSKVYDLTNEDIDEEYFEFALFMSRREYKVIKRRMVRGKQQALKDGYFTASLCPFGFTKEKRGRGWVLIPNEYAPYVEDIYTRYASGQDLMEICRHLNALGIRTAHNKLFDPQSLRRILTNKSYIGYINYDVHNYERKIYKGQHDAIISEELFYKAQARLESRQTKKGRGKDLINPLATILKCGKCGRTMMLNSSRGDYWFRCPSVNCDTSGAKLEMVEEKVLNELKEELKNFNYFLDNYESEIANKKDDIEKEIKALRSEIKKRDNMINKACEMLELGVYSKEKFLERTTLLENEIKESKARIEELESITFEDESAKQAIPILEKVLEEYHTLTPADKNKLLKAIIERIDFYKSVKFKKLTKDKNTLKLNIYLKV